MSTPDDPTTDADLVTPLGSSPLAPDDDAFVLNTLAADVAADPLPADVAARWDAAIAAESAARAVELSNAAAVADGAAPISSIDRTPTVDRTSRRLRFAGAAASVAAIALVGGIVASSVFSNDTTGSANDAITANAAPLPVATSVSTSGLQYQPAGISEQLDNLFKRVSFKPESAAAVTLPPTDAVTPAPLSTTSADASTGSSKAATPAATEAPMAALDSNPKVIAFRTNDKVRADCLAEINEGPGARPVLLDIGYYDRQAAALIVLPTTGDATRLDVWIVGPDCATGDADVLWFGRILRP